MPFKVYIGGQDFSDYFKMMEVEPSGDATIGTGTLYLDAPGGGLTIENMMTVEVWKTYNDAGDGIAAGGRLFGGVLKIRDTTTMGTTKVWALPCWDNNVILQTVVRDVQAAKQVVISAGSFVDQVQQCVLAIQRNGYATVNTEIDAVNGVVDFWATMPAVTYEGGHELAWYIEQLELTARGITSSGGAITATYVTHGGTGYTSAPTVTVAPPPAGGVQAVLTANVTGPGSVGQLDMVSEGTGFTSATVSITGGGGTGATGSVTIEGGYITGFTVTNGGTGYTTAPTVWITGGGGSGATATAAVNAGAVTVLTLTNAGSAYTSLPVVGFTGGGGSGAGATATMSGSGVYALNITNAGSGYTSVPSVVVSAPPGVGVQATATATIDGSGHVTAVNVASAGDGYTAAPSVTLTGGGGSGATADATIWASVTRITVTNAGSGYTLTPGVVIAAPGGGGVTATATAVMSGQQVAYITITNAGTRYTAAPGITFSGGGGGSGAAATAEIVGTINSFSVTAAGTGYTTAPDVGIGAPTGGTTRGTATGTISGGRITSLVVLTAGSGYVSPTVAFSGGSGTGAQAAAFVTAGGVSGLELLDGGSGYTSAPAVAISGGGGTGASATASILGHVSSLTISNAGRGYPTAPAILFEGGGGSGAIAVAIVSAVVYDILPAHYMGVGATFGAVEVFGPPVLYIYDSLETPGVGYSFSDVVAGGRLGVYGEFRRVTDASMPIVQRQQATWGSENLSVTSQSLPSQETYPNPYINHGGPDDSGAWMLPALRDDTSQSFAEAQAALDRVIQVKAFPRDTYTFDTEARVFPGDTIGLGWTLEGIPDDTPMRVAKVSIVIEPPDVVLSTLTVNTRRLGMFDDGMEGVFAPPIEGDAVAPLPPADFSLTVNSYDGETGDSDLTFLITASPSPDVIGYRIVGRVGHARVDIDVETNLTPTLIFPSNQAYDLQAVAYDHAGNISDPAPEAALQGLTAVPVYKTVPNSDFDNFDRVDETLPRNWTRTTANGGTATWDPFSNSGPGCANLTTTATGGSTAMLTSSMTVVAGGSVYGEIFWARSNSGTPTITCYYDWYDNVQAFISTTSFASVITTSYARYTGTMVRPATAAFYKVRYGITALSTTVRVDTTSHQPQTPNDGIETITDVTKVDLWTDPATPRNIRDTTGVLRGSESASTSTVLYKGINTGGSSPISVDIRSSTADTLFLAGNGADTTLTSTTGLTLQAATGSAAALIGNGGVANITSGPGAENYTLGNLNITGNLLVSESVQIAAGTTTITPIKLTSGTNLTTPEAGAQEFDGSAFYVTPVVDRHALEMVSAPITSSTSVTNTTTETTLFTGTISANELKVGRMVRAWLLGKYTTGLTGHTATMRVKVGGVTIVTVTPAASPGTSALLIDFVFTIRSVGGSGSLWQNSHVEIGNTITNNPGTATNTVDTTAACDVTLTWQWSGTSLSDVASIDQGIMEFIH